MEAMLLGRGLSLAGAVPFIPFAAPFVWDSCGSGLGANEARGPAADEGRGTA